MRILPVAAIGLLTLAGCGPSSAKSAPVRAGPEGSPAAPRATSPKPKARAADSDAVFQRDEPAAATMTLDREGEVWRVTFRAGAFRTAPRQPPTANFRRWGLRTPKTSSRLAWFRSKAN